MKLEAEFYTRNGAVYDKNGRFRIFRGFSVRNEIPADPAADSYFIRLASSGCTLLFWNLYWESIEPSGPDEYDEEYLANLRRLLKKAEEYDIRVVLEPYQVQWSRLTGGCGAPEWTLSLAGFDSEKLRNLAADTDLESGAAGIGYVCATMNTLFWGGDSFAPEFLIEGEPAGRYFQSHYIAAMKHAARRLKDCSAVIGFGCMYGAHPGYIGCDDLREYAAGFKSAVLDARIWRDGADCPWRRAGVWHETSDKTAAVDKPEYFCRLNGNAADFGTYFLKPFQKRFIEALEKKHDQYLFFPESAVTGDSAVWQPYGNPALLPDRPVEKEGGVLAEGDAETLKIVLPFILLNHAAAVSKAAAAECPAHILRTAKETAMQKKLPLIVVGGNAAEQGDCSPYSDIVSAVRTAAAILFGKRSGAAELYGALDELQLSYIYGEDCDTAGCAEENLCRPYACAVNGRPLRSSFCAGSKPVFEFEWEARPQQSGTGSDSATELVIPALWYPSGWKVDLFDGVGTLTRDPEHNRLYITTLTERRCRIRIVSA